MSTVTKEEVAEWFCEDVTVLEGAKILYAVYDQGCYEGSAFVLFSRDGKLYEVNGSHCSCYGLETQFDPEETSVEALEHRLTNGYFYVNDKDGIAAAVRKYKNAVKRAERKKSG